MKKSDLLNLLADLEKFDLNEHQIIDEKTKKKFEQYFSNTA